MAIYSLSDRLPDLPLDPPEPDFECNNCGHLFNIGLLDADDLCPECDSEDIHRT